jgi:cation transport ATPase
VVDALRAGHVALYEGGFLYFCRAECKNAFLGGQGPPAGEVITERPPPIVDPNASAKPPQKAPGSGRRRKAPTRAEPPQAGGRSSAVVPGRARQDLPSAGQQLPRIGFESEAAGRDGEEDEQVRSAERASIRPPEARPEPRGRAPASRGDRRIAQILSVIDASGIVAGAVVPALGLLGPAAEATRVPLAVAASVALLAHASLARRDPADPHPVVVLFPSVGAVVAACWAAAINDSRATSIAVLAGLSCAAALLVEVLVGRARQRVAAARARIEEALDVRGRAVHGHETVVIPASDIRPGEQIVVEAGEVVAVDGTVAAGEARVVPWLEARSEIVRTEGDPIVAGARVLSSRLRITTTWSGRDRAWVKLIAPRSTRVDVAAPTSRALRHTVERGAPLAALLVGMGAFATNSTLVQILAAMSAGAFAFAAKGVASFAALHVARAHLDALASGISYKDARAFERAAATGVAVLSARGTVLLGEPEIVAVEPIGGTEVERVLSLAAGAETASSHPFAAAILRAARARSVKPDDVRNATVHAGLGVTALASTGERLVVGGRAIMLEQKIGVAVSDARVGELEAQGRSVLLVALGDRVVGLIALQDGLRAGARAAVQRLLDARVEPVLMSGEARETCETIGRALDIEHVRPEVLPADRGAAVHALSESGSLVAVIGHAARDDGALGAADVAIAMSAAGATPGEWAVALAGDDVRDAAMALAIPHAARDRVRVAIALGAAPCVIALLAIGFGIAPPAVAPLAAALSVIAVAVQARESTAV